MPEHLAPGPVNAQIASHRLAGSVQRGSVATPDGDLKTGLPRRRTHSIRLLDLLCGRLDQIDHLGRMRNHRRVVGVLGAGGAGCLPPGGRQTGAKNGTPATLGALLPRAVMICPPYECPATIVGPLWRTRTSRSRATSSDSLVNANWGAVTLNPSLCSRSITALQLEPSAQAP